MKYLIIALVIFCLAFNVKSEERKLFMGSGKVRAHNVDYFCPRIIRAQDEKEATKIYLLELQRVVIETKGEIIKDGVWGVWKVEPEDILTPKKPTH